MTIHRSLLTLAAAIAVAAQATPVEWRTPVQKPYAGSLQEFTIASPELGREMRVNVWLPEGYDPAGEPRPVLYMHDAQNLYDPTSTWNHQAWRVDSVATVMAARGEITAPIVVGIYNEKHERMSYLMPEDVAAAISPQSRTDFKARCELGLLGNEYADFLAGTLKLTIDSLYHTDPRPAATAVMGSSMGGLASLYAMSRHPEVFGGAGALSTHVIGDFEPNEVFPSALAAYLAANLPPADTHRLYFDTGDQTLDAFYQPYFPRFTALFAELGYGPDSLLTAVYPGHAHMEDSWMARLNVPLAFLLR